MRSLVVYGKARNPVKGDTMELHAWNIVEIEGKTYHLDVTFDMSLTDKTNRYDYFNLSDEDIKKEHVIINVIPPCTTIGYDYFTVNNLVVNSPADLDRLIEHCLMHGKKSIMVKLRNVNDTDHIADRVIALAQQQYGRIFKSSVMVEINYNLSQLVFEINFA